MSRQRSPGGAPSAFTRASLAAKRAAYPAAGSARPSQVRCSASVYTRSRKRGPSGPASTRAIRSTAQTSIPSPTTAIAQASCIRASMSRTARSIPTSTARATMAWPMLSSSISAMRAMASTFW